ncbi:sensor histidine kinase [Gracilibacillus dipsosauri]|uniref:sensor histidine kinase n=1 Tax=Gracilibacillus dipsosauri TaxID=178340 RepID=UPI00240A99BB
MKTIRIRKFTMLSLFLILLLPWIFYVAANFLETKSFNISGDEANQKDIETVVQQIEKNSGNWTDFAWQNQISQQLEKINMDVVILSPSDQEIFQTDDEEVSKFRVKEHFSILQDGKLLGRVVIYQSNSRVIPLIAAFVGLMLSFFIVGFEMRRFILKPLEEMSVSAREIANGDLDVKLPSSHITEIAEVNEGFKVMVGGLKEAFQKQVELEEERRFVVAAVAHDLRTPLFALRGYLDGLEQGIADSPEKMAEYLSVCKEKSAQLGRLVEELFTYTKTEYLNIELEKIKVDLASIVQRSIGSLETQAERKFISIRAGGFDENCLVMADIHSLERVLNNLLDNAVRYTPEHGKIMIDCYKCKNKAFFTIRDTGAGFTSEELQRVFEPLYRGEASRNRSTGGIGLGLSICKRLMKRHGGDLLADNHPDGGAILKGWLPLVN